MTPRFCCLFRLRILYLTIAENATIALQLQHSRNLCNTVFDRPILMSIFRQQSIDWQCGSGFGVAAMGSRKHSWFTCLMAGVFFAFSTLGQSLHLWLADCAPSRPQCWADQHEPSDHSGPGASAAGSAIEPAAKIHDHGQCPICQFFANTKALTDTPCSVEVCRVVVSRPIRFWVHLPDAPASFYGARAPPIA